MASFSLLVEYKKWGGGVQTIKEEIDRVARTLQ